MYNCGQIDRNFIFDPVRDVARHCRAVLARVTECLEDLRVGIVPCPSARRALLSTNNGKIENPTHNFCLVMRGHIS